MPRDTSQAFKVGDHVFWNHLAYPSTSKDGAIVEIIDGDTFILDDGTKCFIEEMTLLYRPGPIPECLSSADGQFMVNMAHRYAMGRMTSAPSVFTSWARANWDSLTDVTKHRIVEETMVELARPIPSYTGGKHHLGSNCDLDTWRLFADWGFQRLYLNDKKRIFQLFQSYRKPWPIPSLPPGEHLPGISDSRGDAADEGNSQN